MTEVATTNETFRVLLFEDNRDDGRLVEEYLKAGPLSCELTCVARLSEGLDLLRKRPQDVILLDLSLPDGSGIGTVEAVTESGSGEVVIVLTGSDDEALSLGALQAGAQDYLCKDDLNGEVLHRAIRYAMERAKLMRRLERHSREAEERETLLRRIFDANTDAMLILGSDFRIRFLNDAAGRLLESDETSLIGEMFPFNLERGEKTEFEIPGPDGNNRIVELNAVDLHWEGESALLVLLRDVSAWRRAEEALQREKERLAVTLDSISDAVIAIRATDEVERMNEEAARLTGVDRETAVGRPLAEVLRLAEAEEGTPAPDPRRFLLGGGDGISGVRESLVLRSADGGECRVSAEIRCIIGDEGGAGGCVVVLRDISEQQRSQEELLKAEKLRSISQLAGGIAHDFNNLLSAVIGNISVARTEVPEGQGAKLEAAENAALQAKTLTQQLLTFSRGGTPVLEATTIDKMAEDCAQFILRGSNVRCEVRKDEELWAVEADRGQISQVINNLIINADQAMPDGGVVTLELRNRSVRRNEVPALEPGEYVCITVSDEGCGIAPADLRRIFDPYFTTKEEGNGLGLSSSYSIVKNHGGSMTVDSRQGEGATFRLYLPRSHREPAEAPDTAVEEDSGEPVERGSGRILVMDDMEAMMMVAGEIINVLGYEVEYSRDGEEAIERYRSAREEGNPFDAVVFDLTVPGGMGGEEACRRLLEEYPDLVAIASSGYTTSNVMSDFASSGFKAVVPKPYRIKEMSEALRAALG